ncbi:MAG: TadE/TadG family type IV pilus assembly protein [Terriglobia bacterium]
MSAGSGALLHRQRERGAALLEFAFALPLLLIMVAGIYDFGSVYTLKDKMTNAAREGARIATNQPPDLASNQCNVGGTTYNAPCSVSLAMLAVQSYLSAAGLTTCGIGTNAAAAGNFVWTYSSASPGCGANPILTVERSLQISANGATAFATRVTLQYPVSWDFADVAGPSSGIPGSFWISTNAVMQNPW